jgi:fluoride exporter
MNTWLWVALGSALGAPTRYLLDQFIQSRYERVFPWGTFTINVTGSFLLGLLVAAGAHHPIQGWLLAAAGTGFLGSYTTFSTFTWESLRLIEDGSRLVAILNLTASVATGATFAAAGLWLGALLAR